MKTYLHLLQNFTVPPHHQNICTLHRLLFKLILHQTQISVLLSYSVQRNYDKEMLSNATQSSRCKQHPLFQAYASFPTLRLSFFRNVFQLLTT